MTGKVTDDGIRHSGHHRAGRIDDVVAGTKVRSVPLASERHGEIVPRDTLDGSLDPYHTTGVNIGFQRWYRRGVVGKEVTCERVVPIENDHVIIAEWEASQLRGRKRAKGMPVSRNRIRKDGPAPRIVRLEYSKLVWRWLAIGKRVINRVTRDQGKVIRRVTEG